MISVGFSGKVLSAFALVLTLSACSSISSFSPRSLVSGGTDPKAEQEALERFAPVAVCPDVQVREGTQMLAVFEKGKQGDLSAVRFQGTIRKFARECRTDASGTTTIKVGVAGRLLAGPNGAVGATTLPVRVVLVRNGDEEAIPAERHDRSGYRRCRLGLRCTGCHGSRRQEPRQFRDLRRLRREQG
jgi:hypothetical protein